MENSKSKPINEINKQLDKLKDNFSSILEFKRDSLDMFLKLLNRIIVMKNINKKIELMEVFNNNLDTAIRILTINYMTLAGINPPPRSTLPDKMSYNKFIIRNAHEKPILKYINFVENLSQDNYIS